MTETEKEGRWYNNCHEYGKYGDSWEEIEKWMYPDPSPVKGTEEWRLLFSKFQKGGNSTGTRKNLSKANEMKAEQGEKAAAKFKGRRRKKGKLKIRSQKKDRSQTKLKKFFEVKKNSEGYPMQHCKYHPVLKEYVYFPPDYGKNGSARYPDFKRFCNNCRLCPCIANETYYDAWDYAKAVKEKTVDGKNMSKEEVRADTQVWLMKQHCKLLKTRYGKKKPVPACIRDLVQNDLPPCHGSDTESERVTDEGSDSETETESETEF
jgi:hypothetical protein